MRRQVWKADSREANDWDSEAIQHWSFRTAYLFRIILSNMFETEVYGRNNVQIPRFYRISTLANPPGQAGCGRESRVVLGSSRPSCPPPRGSEEQ